jgi:sec-independent protein translocase protein TatA
MAMFHLPTGTELLLILGVAMLVFGTGKLKNVGKDLGVAIKEFKTAFSDKPENKDGGAGSAS